MDMTIFCSVAQVFADATRLATTQRVRQKIGRCALFLLSPSARRPSLKLKDCKSITSRTLRSHLSASDGSVRSLPVGQSVGPRQRGMRQMPNDPAQAYKWVFVVGNLFFYEPLHLEVASGTATKKAQAKTRLSLTVWREIRGWR